MFRATRKRPNVRPLLSMKTRLDLHFCTLTLLPSAVCESLHVWGLLIGLIFYSFLSLLIIKPFHIFGQCIARSPHTWVWCLVSSVLSKFLVQDNSAKGRTFLEPMSMCTHCAMCCTKPLYSPLVGHWTYHTTNCTLKTKNQF